MNIFWVWLLVTGSILNSLVFTAEVDETLEFDAKTESDDVNNQILNEVVTDVSTNDNSDDNDWFIPTWTANVTCENGAKTWNSCYTDAVQSWSSVNDVDKRDCCANWHLYTCWANQVKAVCSEISPTIMEQCRTALSNQTRCVKYYDISVCKAQPLPVWANILILAVGASLITGAAVFVYWRWIRLI